MAQHHPLSKTKEPKIFESIKKIGKRLTGKGCLALISSGLTEFDIYGKTVQLLPDEYKTHECDYYVANVGRYTLEEDWEEDNWLTENTKLECHFDYKGNVMSIYFVV